jgi:hypothetical protein
VADGTADPPADDDYDPGEWPQPDGQVDAGKYGEPEEFDPMSLGPEIPTPPDPTETDADIDPGTHRLFWGLVVLFNVALLALSLGVMFAAFEGRLELGAQLVLVGIVLSAYGYFRYRRFRRAGSDEPGGETASDAGDQTDARDQTAAGDQNG